MPVSFAPGPHPSASRRPSASSPYPGRTMTSVRPDNLASPKSKKRAPPVSRPANSDPFLDDVHEPTNQPDESGFEAPCCSPQTERYTFFGEGRSYDPESQPLLGAADRRPGAVWRAVLGTVLAIAVITFFVLGLWRLAEETSGDEGSGQQ